MLFNNLTFPVAGELLQAIIFSVELNLIVVDRQKMPGSFLILYRQLKSSCFCFLTSCISSCFSVLAWYTTVFLSSTTTSSSETFENANPR